MLYTEQNVRDNLRNREGKRVFFLGKNDRLTSGARDYLTRERIPILPAEQAKIENYRLIGGGFITEKPEHMTHLHGDVLVSKTHPRILFRGAMDTLEAELKSVRERGYAIENGEFRVGIRGVAAPVYTHSGTVQYALGLIGMFRRIDSDEFRAATALVVKTAKALSEALGWRMK